MKKIIGVALLLFGVILNTNANNIQISNTSVSGSNISFNISWDNSWNANIAPNNWDAAWVFIKYQDCATKLWAHASLSTIAADHTAGAPLQVDPVTDGKGVFIRRSALGGGSTGTITVTLKMTIPVGNYNYKVSGIEMVNVPQGNFEIGDGASLNSYNNYTITANSQSAGIPAYIISTSSLAIPSTYPMGYNSFYCMKYEITQEQYVEFLNTLTYDQQSGRTVNPPNSSSGTRAFFNLYRNGIVINIPGLNSTLPAVYACDLTATNVNSTNDGQNIACNYLSTDDVAAYLDWAALRPMTELEYEKACRGPMPRLANEYPWGTTAIYAAYANAVVNPNTASETYSSIQNGPCVIYVSTSNLGPLRVGIFATSSSGRASSGAGYYGAMELGGNVYEQVVTTDNANGTSYTGNLGDGILSPLTGSANQPSWPTYSGGAAVKGGSWGSINSVVYTSYRSGSNSASFLGRQGDGGGRGVR